MSVVISFPAPRAPSELHRRLRAQIEGALERDIVALDTLDGDADLKPFPARAPCCSSVTLRCRGGGEFDEPFLGASEGT